MNQNESKMKKKGESRVWQTILTKSDNFKNISSTQIGQQLLLDEALLILPKVREWIDHGSAKVYRSELQGYFNNDEILLEKILQTFLFLSGVIYEQLDEKKQRAHKSRHKKINTLKAKITPELSFDQTWRFLEVVIDLSDYFEVEALLNVDKGVFKWNMRYKCTLSEVIMGKLALEAAVAFYPMPMLEPPVDWLYDDKTKVLKGGYKDHQYEMVRAYPRKVDYSLYSERIYNAVNYIQSTPWVVNEPVLEQLKKDIKIPKKLDFIKTQYPDSEPCRWDLKIDEEDHNLSQAELLKLQETRQDFRDKAALYNADIKDFESALGKYRAIKLAIYIADKYRKDTIWFPHSFDFRGRVYPLPIGLSPQGSDAVKALLLYKNTEPLTTSGQQWNWAYLASLYGDDKLPFLERVKRGKELIDEDYTKADEPYQFLSHQLELKQWIEDPNYIPNTRIHLDACNSGSQFTSAITGDKQGCQATNVMPTFDKDNKQLRQDAYLLVAEKSLELLSEQIKAEQDKDIKEVLKFIRTLLLKDGRKICKTPVMVSNYGGTAGGRAEILWQLMRELQVDRKWISKKNANLFAKIIGDSIQGVLNGGKAFEYYIHRMNNAITQRDQPIIWHTSDGFHIVHIKNKELKAKQVSCTLPNARKQTTITKKIYSDKISATKMKSAISPNYIHSLDAELVRRTALKMKRAGIADSDWIHDSFGCHPNYVDQMLDITKKEFLKMIKARPLNVLDKELREQAPSTRKVKRMLEAIKVPHLRGFSSQNDDLDIVLQSEWFFS